MSAFIQASALDGLRSFFEDLPDVANKAASIAINDALRSEGMAMLRKEMRDDIAFPPGYLEGDKFKITRFAHPERLEAVVRGRDRPTSLARFALAGQTATNTRGKGIRLKVKGSGGSTSVNKGFLINLRGGNTGLAIRLPPGVQPKKTTRAKELTQNGGVGTSLWLLYGPSVDQVFRGVASERTGEISQMVVDRFIKQYTRLSNRG